MLSGFLITHLLLEEHAGTGRIDLKGFWHRRLKRLVPAIVAVIVVTAALCTGLNHVMLTKMRPDIIPSALFVNNWWQIFNQQSYFNAVGDPSPLTHFWSLAIEMQFYLVWPVALMIALSAGQGRRRIRRATFALACVSTLEMALLYNPPWTRAACTTERTRAPSRCSWAPGSPLFPMPTLRAPPAGPSRAPCPRCGTPWMRRGASWA